MFVILPLLKCERHGRKSSPQIFGWRLWDSSEECKELYSRSHFKVFYHPPNIFCVSYSIIPFLQLPVVPFLVFTRWVQRFSNVREHTKHHRRHEYDCQERRRNRNVGIDTFLEIGEKGHRTAETNRPGIACFSEFNHDRPKYTYCVCTLLPIRFEN